MPLFKVRSRYCARVNDGAIVDDASANGGARVNARVDRVLRIDDGARDEPKLMKVSE